MDFKYVDILKIAKILIHNPDKNFRIFDNDQKNNHHLDVAKQVIFLFKDKTDFKKLLALTIASLVHDIAIPDKYYMAIDKTFIDPEVIKNHPIKGYEILKEKKFPELICKIVLHHHERYAGRGYPFGLSADEIHPLAMGLALAEIIVFATSNLGSFKISKNIKEVIEEILQEQSFKKFFDILFEKYGFYPENTQVLLNNGKIAVVREQTDNIFAPVVLLDGELVDLSKSKNFYILTDL